MKFDRHVRTEGKSWAYWQFNEYETQINHMYWSGVAAMSHSMHKVRHASLPVDARAVLCASGPNSIRFPSDQRKFLSHSEEFLKWNRSSFIVAATGSLETYFQRVILTALLSDPGLIYGKSRIIDGISWLKLGVVADHTKTLESATSGTWHQRYASIKKLFGDIPIISGHIAELDKIRIFRNNVGHAFGRALTTNPNLTTRQAERMRSINEKQFQNWLGVISETAAALDEILVANHIGDFEPVLHLHAYVKSLKLPPTFNKEFSRTYKVLLAQAEGHSKGLAYCEGLVSAYQKA